MFTRKYKKRISELEKRLSTRIVVKNFFEEKVLDCTLDGLYLYNVFTKTNILDLGNVKILINPDSKMQVE